MVYKILTGKIALEKSYRELVAEYTSIETDDIINRARNFYRDVQKYKSGEGTAWTEEAIKSALKFFGVKPSEAGKIVAWSTKAMSERRELFEEQARKKKERETAPRGFGAAGRVRLIGDGPSRWVPLSEAKDLLRSTASRGGIQPHEVYLQPYLRYSGGRETPASARAETIEEMRYMQDAIVSALTESGNEICAAFESTWKTWEHKPTVTATVDIDTFELAVIVTPTEVTNRHSRGGQPKIDTPNGAVYDLFGLVDSGAPVHYIKAVNNTITRGNKDYKMLYIRQHTKTGWRHKTAPGRLAAMKGADSPMNSGYWLPENTLVRHPGFPARNFEETIFKRYRGRVVGRLMRATHRAFRVDVS